MKLIIAGASGYVATECIRQALQDPRFTTVIALARREVTAPTDLGPQANPAKLISVVVKNYDIESYEEEVKRQLVGADACIWTVAVTPGKAQMYAWEEVVKVCKESALVGLRMVVEARGERHGKKPMRFVYMSGNHGERDQRKSPWLLREHVLMRGAAETAILELAAEYPGQVEACCAKPGLIYTSPNLFLGAVRWLPLPLPVITVQEVAAAMLDQVVGGFEKEPLMSGDLARIGSAALKALAEK